MERLNCVTSTINYLRCSNLHSYLFIYVDLSSSRKLRYTILARIRRRPKNGTLLRPLRPTPILTADPKFMAGSLVTIAAINIRLITIQNGPSGLRPLLTARLCPGRTTISGQQHLPPSQLPLSPRHQQSLSQNPRLDQVMRVVVLRLYLLLREAHQLRAIGTGLRITMLSSK